MTVGEAIEEARLGGHIERIIRLIISQLVYAIVGEVERAICIPIKAHCIPDACSTACNMIRSSVATLSHTLPHITHSMPAACNIPLHNSTSESPLKPDIDDARAQGTPILHSDQLATFLPWQGHIFNC